MSGGCYRNNRDIAVSQCTYLLICGYLMVTAKIYSIHDKLIN